LTPQPRSQKCSNVLVREAAEKGCMATGNREQTSRKEMGGDKLPKRFAVNREKQSENS